MFKHLTFLFIILTFFIACKKKKTEVINYPVQNVPVNERLYPNDPIYAGKLTGIGGWVYYNNAANTAGLFGLIIYKKSAQEFVVIERASPESPTNKAGAVKVQPDNFTLRDTITNAKWQIIDGGVISGSKWILRIYYSTYDGNVLIISN